MPSTSTFTTGATTTRAMNLTYFNNDQRLNLLDLYKKSKESGQDAMKLINSIDGYQEVNERRIKRWLKQSVLKCPGRPISTEFEDEVLMECELVSKKFGIKKKFSGTSNRYSYNLVKECAVKVFNRDYWDASQSSSDKKWQRDPYTSKLHFTNKWVVGLFHRDLKKRNTSLVDSEEHKDINSIHSAKELPENQSKDTLDFDDFNFENLIAYPEQLHREVDFPSSTIRSSETDFDWRFTF